MSLWDLRYVALREIYFVLKICWWV